MIPRLALSDLSTIDEPLALALGVFDGVHLGHQKVLAAARTRAKESGGLAGVLTFEPHPIQVLAPERAPRRLLAGSMHKRSILEELGMDLLVVVDFDRSFAARTAEEFLQILQTAPHLTALAVGEDWQFGKNRGGDAHLLKAFGQEFSVAIDSVSAIMDGGERISSTRIRQALRDGNLAAAEQMLGRPYSIIGRVMEGKQLGRTIGFPTANLLPEGEQLPPEGVWAVEARLPQGDWLAGVGNLGRRPTVKEEGLLKLEVHLFDWEEDFYGQNLEVRFRHFLRGERKFADLDALKKQIVLDADEARQFFVL